VKRTRPYKHMRFAVLAKGRRARAVNEGLVLFCHDVRERFFVASLMARFFLFGDSVYIHALRVCYA
jgi:hypothetical protein